MAAKKKKTQQEMHQIDFVDAASSKANEKIPAAGKTTSSTPRRSSHAGKTKATRQADATVSRSVPPRDGYKRLNADIPATLHKRVKMQALVEDRNITDIVCDAIKAYLVNK